MNESILPKQLSNFNCHFGTRCRNYKNGVMKHRMSAIGCIMSHMCIWRRIAEEKEKNRWYLIIEDDCHPDDIVLSSKKMQKLYASMGSESTEWDCVQLNYRDHGGGDNSYFNGLGSECMLMNGRGARKMIAYANNEIFAPADRLLFHTKYRARSGINTNYEFTETIRLDENDEDQDKISSRQAFRKLQKVKLYHPEMTKDQEAYFLHIVHSIRRSRNWFWNKLKKRLYSNTIPLENYHIWKYAFGPKVLMECEQIEQELGIESDKACFDKETLLKLEHIEKEIGHIKD